jgi:hypothetical protein
MPNTGRKSERDESSGASSVGGGSVEDTSDVSGIADRIAQGFSSGDIDTLNSLYADTVDYLDSGPISSADVQRQIQEYFTRWPVRQWTITSPVKVKSMGGSVQQLTFSARYTVSDPQTGRRASGTARETLLLQPDANGAMKIISQHEKTSAEKSSNSARHRGEKVYDGKPVDNERPIIHLPPNIPWPPGIPRP